MSSSRTIVVSHERTTTGAPKIAIRLAEEMGARLVFFDGGDAVVAHGAATVLMGDRAGKGNTVTDHAVRVARFQEYVRSLGCGAIDRVVVVSLSSCAAADACLLMGIPYVLCIYESTSDFDVAVGAVGPDRLPRLLALADHVVCGAHPDGYGKRLHDRVRTHVNAEIARRPTVRMLQTDHDVRITTTMPPVDFDRIVNGRGVVVPKNRHAMCNVRGQRWRASHPPRRVVLVVGTWCARKGCRTVVRAAALLPDWDFVWIGAMADPVPTKTIGTNVYLSANAIPNPFAYARTHMPGCVFLLPSKHDPSPLTIPEAIAHGMYTVCFRNAGDGWCSIASDDQGMVLPGVRRTAELVAALSTMGAKPHAALGERRAAHAVGYSEFARMVEGAFVRDERDGDDRPLACRIAVHVHVGYGGEPLHDVAHAVSNLDALKGEGVDSRVVVTVVAPSPDDALFAETREAFPPPAVVQCVPNRGADICPFVRNFLGENLGALSREVDFVIKVHTKSDRTARRDHLEALLSNEALRSNIGAFKTNPRIGMIGAPRWIHIIGNGGMQEPPRKKALASFIADHAGSLLRVGFAETWDPSLVERVQRGASVDLADYRAHNPDLRHMDDAALARHWTLHGRFEFRYPFRKLYHRETVVAATLQDRRRGRGSAEERRPPAVVWNEYLQLNPDVRAAFASLGPDGALEAHARRHWDLCGKNEGRFPSFAALNAIDAPKFVGGTMFWARAPLLASAFEDMRLDEIEFEDGYENDSADKPTPSQTHMTERLLGFLVTHFNFCLHTPMMP